MLGIAGIMAGWKFSTPAAILVELCFLAMVVHYTRDRIDRSWFKVLIAAYIALVVVWVICTLADGKFGQIFELPWRVEVHRAK